MQLICTVGALWCLLLSDPAPDALTVTARVAADKLEPGGKYQIVIDYAAGPGFVVSESGLPAPLLQIQTAPSVRLTGVEAKSLVELKKTGFLNRPYERFLEKASTEVEFELTQEPGENEVIFLNVIAYAQQRSMKDARLVRVRLSLPVRPNAGAMAVEATSSSWGVGDFLQIGDKAAPFELPRADGSTVSLAKYFGTKNVVIVTYRAHWSPYCGRQLTELHVLAEEFAKRDAVVIAIAQEDTDLKSHGKILERLRPTPRIEVVADLHGKGAPRYDRTTAYLIDKQGVVRQVFPMADQYRGSTFSLLNEIDHIGQSQP